MAWIGFRSEQAGKIPEGKASSMIPRLLMDRRRPAGDDCVVWHCPVCVKYLKMSEVTIYGFCVNCGIDADWFVWAELVNLGREVEKRSGDDRRS